MFLSASQIALCVKHQIPVGVGAEIPDLDRDAADLRGDRKAVDDDFGRAGRSRLVGAIGQQLVWTMPRNGPWTVL